MTVTAAPWFVAPGVVQVFGVGDGVGACLRRPDRSGVGGLVTATAMAGFATPGVFGVGDGVGACLRRPDRSRVGGLVTATATTRFATPGVFGVGGGVGACVDVFVGPTGHAVEDW